MHFVGEQYEIGIEKESADLLRIANACACSLAVASSRIKHSIAGLGLATLRTFQRGDATGSSRNMLGHHEPLSRKHTRKVYENGVLKVYGARFSKFALQDYVRKRWFERVTERVEEKNFTRSSCFLLCVCAQLLLQLRQRKQRVQSMRKELPGEPLLAECRLPAELNVNRKSSGRPILSRFGGDCID